MAKKPAKQKPKKRTRKEQEARAERLNRQMARAERLNRQMAIEGLGVEFNVNHRGSLYINASSWGDLMCFAEILAMMEEHPTDDDDADLSELAKPGFGNAWIEIDDDYA